MIYNIKRISDDLSRAIYYSEFAKKSIDIYSASFSEDTKLTSHTLDASHKFVCEAIKSLNEALRFCINSENISEQ